MLGKFTSEMCLENNQNISAYFPNKEKMSNDVKMMLRARPLNNVGN